ncbi:MAG: zinc ribbon domain-containing protein [Conexivisphaerales archaeon]
MNGIRTSGNNRKFRTKLNRWPYRLYQKMIECKSQYVYVNLRGTSSECPVCGDKLTAWGISKCETCGVDYDRLAIILRLPVYRECGCLLAFFEG